MFALAKSLLLLARYFRRIATALEDLRALYVLDLQSRGIRPIDPTISDEVEISYDSHDPSNSPF